MIGYVHRADILLNQGVIFSSLNLHAESLSSVEKAVHLLRRELFVRGATNDELHHLIGSMRTNAKLSRLAVFPIALHNLAVELEFNKYYWNGDGHGHGDEDGDGDGNGTGNGNGNGNCGGADIDICSEEVGYGIVNGMLVAVFTRILYNRFMYSGAILERYILTVWQPLLPKRL